MPLIKSAIKKMRKDVLRQQLNQGQRSALRTVVSKARATKEQASITLAISLLDRAAKKHVIHANKAARKKSVLMKLLHEGAPQETPVVKQTTKKPQKRTKKTA